MTESRKLTVGGALVAAILASSCCLGPLLLGALGIGGVGAFVPIGAYRPHILAAMAVLLGAGFYLTHRRKSRTSMQTDTCGCERRSSRERRVATAGLWIASFVVIAIALAPTLIAKTLAHPVATAASTNTEQAVIRVQGIDCQACAAPLTRALQRVGGFHGLALDIPNQSITVTYNPSPGRLQAYAAAINELGYEATLPTETGG
jgi:mercuric ion transport protein